MPGRPRQPVPSLLPASARRPAGILIGCCAVFLTVLGVLSANESQGNAVDRPIDSWIVGHVGQHWHTLLLISDLGGGLEVLALTVILVLACLSGRRINGAALAIVSVPVAVGLTEYVLKPLVHQTIKGSPSYPSGHTTSLFALITIVAVLLLAPPGNRPRPALRLLIVIGLVLVGCIVAVALVGLEFHYFTDTVAGAALGIGVVLTATFLLDGSAIRRALAIAQPSRRRDSPGDS